VAISNGMTRAPLIAMPSARRAADLKNWVENTENYYQIASAFNSTSRFARLTSVWLPIQPKQRMNNTTAVEVELLTTVCQILSTDQNQYRWPIRIHALQGSDWRCDGNEYDQQRC
jgi:hypothetical protein